MSDVWDLSSGACVVAAQGLGIATLCLRMRGLGACQFACFEVSRHRSCLWSQALTCIAQKPLVTCAAANYL